MHIQKYAKTPESIKDTAPAEGLFCETGDETSTVYIYNYIQ